MYHVSAQGVDEHMYIIIIMTTMSAAILCPAVGIGDVIIKAGRCSKSIQ